MSQSANLFHSHHSTPRLGSLRGEVEDEGGERVRIYVRNIMRNYPCVLYHASKVGVVSQVEFSFGRAVNDDHIRAIQSIPLGMTHGSSNDTAGVFEHETAERASLTWITPNYDKFSEYKGKGFAFTRTGS